MLVGLTDATPISVFVKAIDFAINGMVRKGAPSVPELRRLGVARVSFGPSASYATMGLLERVPKEVRTKGTYTGLTEEAITFDQINALAVPRRPS